MRSDLRPYAVDSRRFRLSKQGNGAIAPANGRLGILIPGMGAVTSTFIAGVEAIKQGLADPIGSLTQLGTIRLGKRTEGRTPKIKDFVPLAPLECLSFGTWDLRRQRLRGSGPRACTRGTLAGTIEGAALGRPTDEGSFRSRVSETDRRT